jgi:hypothetical protein
MLDLDSLIGVAKGNTFDNIYPPSVLQIGCLEISVHLIPLWVNGISGLVSLLNA